jgi:two-component system chemotaxis response regulator CheY
MLVLVVDDSSTMVMSLKTTLAMRGFQVETAGNGRDALDKLQTGLKPNLVLTDVNMPVMGGMELIRNIRAIPALKFIPILTLTTESEAAKREEGKRAGATGWLVKPLSGNDLIASKRFCRERKECIPHWLIDRRLIPPGIRTTGRLVRAMRRGRAAR